MAAAHERIDRIRVEIDEQTKLGKLSKEARDGLHLLLDKVAEDESSPLQGLFIEEWVKHVCRNPDDIEKAVKKQVQAHTAACPYKEALEKAKTLSGFKKDDPPPFITLKWLKIVYAFKKEATIVLCVLAATQQLKPFMAFIERMVGK